MCSILLSRLQLVVPEGSEGGVAFLWDVYKRILMYFKGKIALLNQALNPRLYIS